MYATSASTSSPPTVVVVGNYHVGKSSFVKALIGDVNTALVNPKKTRNTLDTNDTSSSSQSNEFEMDQSELIVEPRTITIDSSSVRIVDTAARDVMGTQQQMQSADLVIVLMNAYLVYHEGNDDLDEYWIDQFNDISLYSPIIACFNQTDRLSSQELSTLKESLAAPSKEHFVLERIEFCSAHSPFIGISQIKLSIINVLRDVMDKPRWILIDPFTWNIQSLFECALQRIFRLLDVDGDNVLNLTELEYFNRVCLNEQFTAKLYNLLLRRLTEQNDSFVCLAGLTFLGFRHLMKRFAIAKKWDRCWEVLRFFHYKNDLTLHERVFPSIPDDASIELTETAYILLEKLFIKFADDNIIDTETKSVASSMISSIANSHNQMYNNSSNTLDDSDDDSDEDEGKVLSMDGVSMILSVLPSTRPSLHCTLVDRHVIDHFETAGRKLNKLTKNGWLSFWAMFAVENAHYCFKQLTYLDLSSDTDRNRWSKVVSNSGDESLSVKDKTVMRVLLFGGPQCGKTVFCDRLLCRVPIEHNTRYRHHHEYHKEHHHKSTQHFRAVSNRIGASNEYNFLAITEVPAMTQYIEQSMDNFLSSYDMILFQFDLSESRSFYELTKIYDRMPKNHSLPIQVLATKADLNHVEQYNLDTINNESYDVNSSLNDMGLYPYAQTWITSNDSCDFPQLFDDIFFIATNPHFRRLKKTQSIMNNYYYNKHKLNWKTIIKRTITITVSVSVVLYSAFKIYKWLRSSSSASSAPSSPSHRHQHQYRSHSTPHSRYRR